MISSVCLTVNRFCNFRCPWCYAKGTKYSKSDDISFSLARKLVDFAKTLGASNILLTGGEPTYYPDLLELVKYIKKQKLRSTLLTNGYKFKDAAFVKSIEEAGINTILFSIKAANAGQQQELTGIDAFEAIKQAIRNLSTIKNPHISYCTVVSNDTINNLEEFAQLIAAIDDTKCLVYSACNPIFDENGNVCKKYVPEPHNLIANFTKKWAKINQILNNQALLEQNLASCLWPKDFIKNLRQNHQIVFNCHLQNRSGLIFDKNGRVLVCNSLPSFTIGQYGVDFTNKEEFEKFWMGEELVELYRKICEYPSTKCQSCEDLLECGGGCPLKWFAYRAKDLFHYPS